MEAAKAKILADRDRRSYLSGGGGLGEDEREQSAVALETPKQVRPLRYVEEGCA